MRGTALGRTIVAAAVLIVATGCATLPPGHDYPRTPSTAFADPASTSIGARVTGALSSHPGLSGFRLFPRGTDGLLLRTELTRAAKQSLDIQYYIFAEDDTGKLLQQSILDAADRGVRVRMLIDDTNSFGKPDSTETLTALGDHHNIELRLFNPFSYRGNAPPLRAIDFLVNGPRLNHRMHNKLMVVDGAVAVVGGRNVGDDYFHAGAPNVRFGDFDLAAVGPVVPDLEKSFDAFWNSSLSIPQQALASVQADKPSLPEARAVLDRHEEESDMAALERRIRTGEPLAGVLDGGSALVWAKAAVIADPPEKAETALDEQAPSPTARALIDAMKEVHAELIIVTAYFVPGQRVAARLEDLARRGVHVRVMTNSLASTDVPMVHSAYQRYRKPLVESGVDLYEVRATPERFAGGSGSASGTVEGAGSDSGDESSRARGNATTDRETTKRDSKGSGGIGSGSGSGAPFAMHAKVYVFDRERVFIGSNNLDRRSFKLNTELSLMIDSPELARQIVQRFEQFSASSNSYHVVLERDGPFGPALRWRTDFDGHNVDLTDDPDASAWRRFQTTLYSLLPMDDLL